MLIKEDTFKWLTKQKDNSVDVVITDYPYGTEFPQELFRVCKGNIITFCSQEDYPFKPSERAYWIKTPSTKNYSKHLGRFVEYIFIYRNENGTFNKGLHWSQYIGVYTDMVEEPNGHQWQKPLSLMKRLVRIYTRPSDVVLDCFCGSGATLEACKILKRKYIGIDVEQKWINHCREKGL